MTNKPKYRFDTKNCAHLVLLSDKDETQVTFGFVDELSATKVSYPSRSMYIAFGPIWQADRPTLVLNDVHLQKLQEFVRYVQEVNMLPSPYYDMENA